MKSKSTAIEILESRIAPAAVPLPGLPSIRDAEWLSANAGQPADTGQSFFYLKAGQGLSTGGAGSGTYLMYVEKGYCLVFATDLNYNNVIDYNEITGIAAGDGLRLVSFVDIHGDIATNLKAPATPGSVPKLSDSDNNAANNGEADNRFGGDGRVLLNNTIEKIEFRALQISDLRDQNGDDIVNASDVLLRQSFSSFSLFGNIYAGRGFGVQGDPTSGLFVDQAGELKFRGYDNHPMVNGIKVGTAASGEFFSYGISNRDDVQGNFVTYVTPTGQTGAHIAGVHAAVGSELNINYLIAGKGGVGAAGGNIRDVQLSTDSVGGYIVVAGNGGDGPTGGAGGAIINFADSGSISGKVLIKSGDGGTGSTGAGGNSSPSILGPFNIRGNVALELGDGGNGFTAGGSGASFLAGTIAAPDAIDNNGRTGVGTSHYPVSTGTYVPYIGAHQAIDFNNDGIGDYVFTTENPSQIVVRLGGIATYNNQYGQLTDRAIFLPGLLSSDAITVADFNGDGHPDIAVGSSIPGQTAGIVVYLSKYEDVNRDGVVSGSENVIPDGPNDSYALQNDFLGFYDGRFSALPTIDPFFPISNSLAYNAIQVNKLAAGDFDGDGRIEIAVQATYQLAAENTQPRQMIVFLTPDYENGLATGQYFADFGTDGDLTAQPPIPAVTKIPFFAVGGGSGDTIEIQATALRTGNGASTFDSLIYMVRNALPGVSPVTLNFNNPVLGPVTPAGGGAWPIGRVDTNRNTGGNNVALQDQNLRNFTIADFNNDGRADLAALSSTPQAFVTVLVGDGLGGGAVNSGTADNAGLFFGNAGQPISIISGDFDGDGSADDFALAIVTNAQDTDSVVSYRYNGGVDSAVALAKGFATTTDFVSDDPSMLFANYVTIVGNVASSVLTAGTGHATPNSGPDFDSVLFGSPLNFFKFQVDRYLLKAGDGGNSFAGKGGNGGSLGSTISLNTTVDEVTGISVTELLGALNFKLNLPVDLYAGNGGDGFSTGGNGGNVTGVSVAQTADFYRDWYISNFYAGNGGRGVSSNGGNGGNISSMFVDNGQIFQAGNGGVGRFGGNGGSITGNGNRGNFDTNAAGHSDVPISGLYDTASFYVYATAGNGGDGTKRGGAGGGIKNFAPGLLDFAALAYVAGNGGNSVSGPGGAGGSILDSSPLEQNFGGGIGQADLYLRAGNGGNGTSGGNGGSVANFVDKVAPKSKDGVEFGAPSVLSVIAGHGGNGTSGVGGNGGGITGILARTSGTTPNGDPLFPQYNFNRILAGNGGSSSSLRGGSGGSISNLDVGVQESSFAVVAGAGGDGLFNGGTGGNVLNIKMAAGGGTLANILIAGGAGGNASAFTPNLPLDLTPRQLENMFGGKPGVGGNGGIINGVTSDSTQAHFNLIGGNGGDTITYGTSLDPKPAVGRGGSILNVNIKGDLGNITSDNATTPNSNDAVPIKSYNNILIGETFKSWVITKMNPAVGLGAGTLSDLDGNVGVVVGAAGRNKAAVLDPNQPTVYRSQPASLAKNGDLINVKATNLLSAIAGSVDRIAAINLAKSLVIDNVIGGEKNKIGSTQATDPNYRDANGNGTPAPFEPVLDGRLVDGAVIAHAFQNAAGQPVTYPGKVFIR